MAGAKILLVVVVGALLPPLLIVRVDANVPVVIQYKEQDQQLYQLLHPFLILGIHACVTNFIISLNGILV
jgi:hypothetical protein